MDFDAVDNPEQRAELTNTLIVYCAQEHIGRGTPAWEDAAQLLLKIFSNNGVTSVAALREAMSQRDR